MIPLALVTDVILMVTGFILWLVFPRDDECVVYPALGDPVTDRCQYCRSNSEYRKNRHRKQSHSRRGVSRSQSSDSVPTPHH